MMKSERKDLLQMLLGLDRLAREDPTAWNPLLQAFSGLGAGAGVHQDDGDPEASPVIAYPATLARWICSLRKNALALFDFAPIIAWVTDAEGRIVRANHALERELGWSRQLIKGRLLEDLVAVGFGRFADRRVLRVLQTGLARDERPHATWATLPNIRSGARQQFLVYRYPWTLQMGRPGFLFFALVPIFDQRFSSGP
jgi:PAS domain S-box-containing protein